jgi:hypothetical protein
MEFHLMSDGERSVITNSPVKDCPKDEGWSTRGSVEASSWIHAKETFGFELTPMQADLLRVEGALK